MVKTIYTDNETEMVIIQNENGNFILSMNPVAWESNPQQLELELTAEDIEKLIEDLQYYIDNKNK
jgi:hypothetical protein